MVEVTDNLEEQLPAGLDRVVDFPAIGKSYEIIKAITDLSVCHEGRPVEARILFTCKEVQADLLEEEDDKIFVLKVKIQSAIHNDKPASGPSTTTSSELHALRIFQKANIQVAPQLIAWKEAIQGPHGLLPGGFITYVLMTALPGETLFKLNYWQLPEMERQIIAQEFLPALRQIRALGIEPIDRALRNVLWDQQTKKCSLIDFELWNEIKPEMRSKDKIDLQRWGLVRVPLHTPHYVLWHMDMR